MPGLSNPVKIAAARFGPENRARMNAELLNLPWQIQVSLASGYAGYMLAYTGMRENHRTIDSASSPFRSDWSRPL